MIENLIVVLIVAAALAFSGWRLMPRTFWQRLGAGHQRAASTARVDTAGPYPACSGCPAGGDCSKRR